MRWLLLLACIRGAEEVIDADGDFYAVGVDCDDENPRVHPGADDDDCDGFDEDCDGLVDEDVATVFYADVDGDGYGDPNAPESLCEIASGFVENADDCDDSSSSALPGGVEVCDRLDNDCDGTTDFDGWIPDDLESLEELAQDGRAGHICIDSGTWPSSEVAFTSELWLDGAGAEGTVLDGQDTQMFTTSADLHVSSATIDRARSGVAGEAAFIESEARVTLEELVFTGFVGDTDNGELVRAAYGATLLDIDVDAPLVTIEDIWYGLFYVEDGPLDVDDLEVNDAQFSSTSSSYGTLYHGAGDVQISNYHVSNSSYEFGGAVYGLLFCEDGGGDMALHDISAVGNTVASGSMFFGALSFDGVHDDTVTIDNVALVGNVVEAEASTGLFGYLYNNGTTRIHNLIIAGNTLDAGSAPLLVELGYVVDAQNWDIAHNTQTESTDAVVSVYGDWTMRNVSFVDNGIGETYASAVRSSQTLDADYVNVLEVATSEVFADLDGAFTPTNQLSVDPLYSDVSSSFEDWDLRLQSGSALIDAGDPAILDEDGSASDIGAYGGPLGESW